ncbi:hypothetical protein RN001_005462 [Aquatica leii]|uniref:MICOS complex subunit MIC13 n=1 Tax=Aquatica leii TaxID=1421715 RepID=A0AAN7PCR3_9COLE|nr:hypothetical protein RN001_005462 [Aquatica leii]
MIKFILKSGIVLGAVYYSAQEGVWKHSAESIKVCDKIYDFASPYYNQAKAQLPIEIPDFPKTIQVRQFLKQSWNKGVTASCIFLSNLPENLSTWTTHGVDKIKSNEEIKNMFKTFSGSTDDEKSLKR